MNTIDLNEDKSTVNMAYTIYILYLLSIFLPVLMIVGVIFAYVFDNDSKEILKSHYQFLIRSFWICLLYVVIASLLVFVVIGIVLLPLIVIWWLIRMAKGLKYLIRNQPIPNPKQWLF